MDSRDFAITINLLAGKTKALHENAGKWALKQIAQEFQSVRELFEELVFILKTHPDIPVEQHASSLSNISYDLAAASYILTGRVSKRDALRQHIRELCKVIDIATKRIIGVALLGPMFDFFVRSREISEEAKAIVQLSDVRPPHLLREQTVRPKVVASSAPNIQSTPPSKTPPSVPRQYRVDRVGGQPRTVASKTPPPVLPKYKVEYVGAANRTRKGNS